jgi:hypothetical protein
VDSRTAAKHAVQQHAPGVSPIGGAGVGHAEEAEGDDEHGQPPAASCGHKTQTGRHTREIHQEQIGIRVGPAEQQGSEEGAQSGCRAQRFHVNGECNHGQRDGDEREPHDARGRRQHAVEAGRSPYTEIDDGGATADQGRAIGAVAGMQAPSHRPHDSTGTGPTHTAHQRGDPAPIERQPKQVACAENQSRDADGKEPSLADPLLGGQGRHGEAGRRGGWRASGAARR